MFEIDGKMNDARRDGDAGAGQKAELPLLRGRMIDLKTAYAAIRVPVGEGVQSCTEQHVLRHSALHAEAQNVFCIARAGGKKGAEGAGAVALGSLQSQAKAVNFGSYEAVGERIFKNERVVGGLVNGATHRHAQSSTRRGALADGGVGLIGRNVSRNHRGLHLVSAFSLMQPAGMQPAFAATGTPAVPSQEIEHESEFELRLGALLKGFGLWRKKLRSLDTLSCRRELLNRLAHLEPDHIARWGSMTSAGAVCHLHDSFTAMMSAGPVALKQKAPAQTAYKFAVLYLPVWWRRVEKKLARLDRSAGGTDPAEFSLDRLRLAETLGKFCDEGARVDHPNFGKMTHKQWMRWGYLQMDHHLRQFGC